VTPISSEADARFDLFRRPTTVILFGTHRPLLHWVGYALGCRGPSEYFWTDIRLAGQLPDPTEPLALGVVSTDHLSVVAPDDLRQNDTGANVAISAVIRSDEPPDNIRRIVDFLRLPSHTQELLSSRSQSARPLVLLLSNAHRIAVMYPAETMAAVLRSFVDFGTCLFALFGDDPPRGRMEFDHVLHLSAHDLQHWGEAEIRVEKGDANGPFAMGRPVALKEIPQVAALLSERVGPPTR